MAHVLIVDDEKSIRLTLQAFLEQAGHTCTCAEDAEHALERICESDFDVIITDIILPRKTGMELLHDIRTAAPHAQVIMMTGEPTVETASEAVRAGAADYLLKPISKNAILRGVASAVHVKTLENERRRLEEENKRYQEDLEELIEERTGELQQANARLTCAIEGTIEAMAKAIELKDPYTSGHQQRVADIARSIARRMKIPPQSTEAVYYAGLIHDLGKLTIPSEILTYPRKLTDAEYAIVKQHPQTAYDILKSVEFPWSLADIILQHHERIDGSGYPRGLTGRDMTVEGKILAVADVVEAMAAHRPYRPALGIEEAMAEVERYKGTLYDPTVVEALRALLKADELTL